MVKIIDKLKESYTTSQDPFFSFEFFPPKSDVGRTNLFKRMDRMASLCPIFIDVTWGAGGCTRNVTMEILKYAQTFLGLDVMLHLTCAGMNKDELKSVLNDARECGIQNILALRGDPIIGSAEWESDLNGNGCKYASELVELIKQEHDDYFSIGVAGFPENHPMNNSNGDVDSQLYYLKKKVDAGADFIITQFFYDASSFIEFKNRCINYGINIPIIPGIMPIQSYSSFQRMTSLCQTKIPDSIWDSLSSIKHDDEAVKAFGVQLCSNMCKEIMDASIKSHDDTPLGFHFFTLNLEQSILKILHELGFKDNIAHRRDFPWRASRSNVDGKEEDVRPINWANRPQSYISRTITWEEFPNGRWGANSKDGCPSLCDLNDTALLDSIAGSKEERLILWGDAPITEHDIRNIFIGYLEGKIPILPWCESKLQDETNVISQELIDLNRRGLLTINSQPAVNGVTSDHPIFGWGGVGGHVYQKAYVEFFCSLETLNELQNSVTSGSSISFYAINHSGTSYQFLYDNNDNTADNVDKIKENNDLHTYDPVPVTCALTWGVFPNQEIKQPTVFDSNAFKVWSKEAFQLWLTAWASLYDDESESSALIHDIYESYFLVAVFDNNFMDPKPTIFEFLDNCLGNKKKLENENLNDSIDGAINF